MRLFKRRDETASAGSTAVAERPQGAAVEFSGSTEELLAEIERLTDATRARRDRAGERGLLGLRHLAGMRLVDAAKGTNPEHPSPDDANLPEAEGLPDIPRADLTPELLRAGILRDGCLLVRGLVPPDQALQFAAQIDRSFSERDQQDEGIAAAAGYYEEFQPAAQFVDMTRAWIKEGGGVLAVDSPMLAFEMFDLFRAAGVHELARGYLGEPALVSANKTTLRKADPAVGGAWHQDGRFMGEVRALNLWLSLSRCGDLAPGLDVVPRRLGEFVATGTDEAMLDYQISNAKAQEAAGGKAIIRPIFEPGDALFFDDRFLHQTGSDPSMPNPRFAIESWFFGGSAFPAGYAPIAV